MHQFVDWWQKLYKCINLAWQMTSHPKRHSQLIDEKIEYMNWWFPFVFNKVLPRDDPRFHHCSLSKYPLKMRPLKWQRVQMRLMEIKLMMKCHDRDRKGERENPVTRFRDLDAVMMGILGQRRKNCDPIWNWIASLRTGLERFEMRDSITFLWGGGHRREGLLWNRKQIGWLEYGRVRMAGASTEVEIPKSKCEIFPQAGKRES
jgi:hypothetical protein